MNVQGYPLVYVNIGNHKFEIKLLSENKHHLYLVKITISDSKRKI